MDLASRLALVSSGENGFSELIWNILIDFEKSTTFCPWLKLNIIFGVMCTISWLVYLQAKYFRPSDYRFKFLGIVTRTIFSCVSWPPEVEQSYKCKKGLCLQFFLLFVWQKRVKYCTQQTHRFEWKEFSPSGSNNQPCPLLGSSRKCLYKGEG